MRDALQGALTDRQTERHPSSTTFWVAAEATGRPHWPLPRAEQSCGRLAANPVQRQVHPSGMDGTRPQLPSPTTLTLVADHLTYQVPTT
jgi:hypothetical protein